jgi:uncharacterized protein YjbI with pentapeptide repeats
MDSGQVLNWISQTLSSLSPPRLITLIIILGFALAGSLIIIFFLYKALSKRWRERASIKPWLEKKFINTNQGIYDLFNNWIMKYKAASILAIGVVMLLIVWLLPIAQSCLFEWKLGDIQNTGSSASFKDPLAKMAFDVANESRKTIAQILAGIAALVAFYFMWQRNFLTQQGQITDRFTKAVEQLGSDDIAVRLGGIYALERIAKDSEPDHWQVMEVLTAYVREKRPVNPTEDDRLTKTDFNYVVREILNRLNATTAPATATVTMAQPPAEPKTDEKKKPELPKDIQAILTVIARRLYSDKDEKEGKQIDLRNTDLRGADLAKKGAEEINLKKVNFAGANLSDAKLMSANLQEANLSSAQLQGAGLREAQLQGADLSSAQLQGADLRLAQLQGAYLRLAQLQGAGLREAQLQGADLSSAQLQGADLWRAQLQGADLREAQLQGADLWRAQLQGADLRLAQLQGAYLENAKTLGANFGNAELDGVYFKNIDNTTRDETDWEKLAFEGSAKVRQRVESAQKNPPALPNVFSSTPDTKIFIEKNKELALQDGHIVKAFLSRGQYYSSNDQDIKDAYKTIAGHIRTELPKNLRQEIIARGLGGLLESPIRQ